MKPDLNGYKARLQQIHQTALANFQQGETIELLLKYFSTQTDAILIDIFNQFFSSQPKPPVALLAVGGYGREELHLHSDIDLMLLFEKYEDIPIAQDRSEAFLTFLWDIGLPVAHSVRSLADCIDQGAHDITVATAMLESRYLAGMKGISLQLNRLWRDKLWPSVDFFKAKLLERQKRYQKFHHILCPLEPNVKDGLGGLRDIHVIFWLGKRHLGVSQLEQFVEAGFLTPQELILLKEAQKKLWQIRFALHTLAKRKEDRLLFDYQRDVAAMLKYQEGSHQMGVELFMKEYYRQIGGIHLVSELIIQRYREILLPREGNPEPISVSRRFQIVHGLLEPLHRHVFKQSPVAIFEVFLLPEQYPQMTGLSAQVERLIIDYRANLDDKFRKDLRARSLFMEILRNHIDVAKILRQLHRYGVLSAYLPAFANIVGQMQYDLFHSYTVDEHTLCLLDQLDRMGSTTMHREEDPAQYFWPMVFQELPKRELIYIAGLFHDIAKGRGGDHSQLGMEDAELFCRQHGLSDYDCHLVSWLVRHHLEMSRVAQRCDLNDPETIQHFAKLVGNPIYLRYLSVLTVADIQATNSTLWNVWKDALLQELYNRTMRLLRLGLTQSWNPEEYIQDTRQQALQQLLPQFSLQQIEKIWQDFQEDYFLQYTASEIAWHTTHILATTEYPLILFRAQGDVNGFTIFLYSRDTHRRFVLMTRILEELGFNIAYARIVTSQQGFTLDTYQVYAEAQNGLSEKIIQDALAKEFSQPRHDRNAQAVQCYIPSHFKHFQVKTRIDCFTDERNHRTILELTSIDRPGLLSRVAQAFLECQVKLQSAKITTLGNRVEDIFFITTLDNNPLQPSDWENLHKTILRELQESDQVPMVREITC